MHADRPATLDHPRLRSARAAPKGPYSYECDLNSFTPDEISPGNCESWSTGLFFRVALSKDNFSPRTIIFDRFEFKRYTSPSSRTTWIAQKLEVVVLKQRSTSR